MYHYDGCATCILPAQASSCALRCGVTDGATLRKAASKSRMHKARRARCMGQAETGMSCCEQSDASEQVTQICWAARQCSCCYLHTVLTPGPLTCTKGQANHHSTATRHVSRGPLQLKRLDCKHIMNKNSHNRRGMCLLTSCTGRIAASWHSCSRSLQLKPSVSLQDIQRNKQQLSLCHMQRNHRPV
jgi:hypothetical protein